MNSRNSRRHFQLVDYGQLAQTLQQTRQPRSQPAQARKAWIQLDARALDMPYKRMKHLVEKNFPFRADAIIDFGADKRFALVMPRSEVQSCTFRKWDIGYLQVDPSREELLFEGDFERYRIPCASIRAFAVEQVVFAPSEKKTPFEYLVKVEFETDYGVVEKLFAQRHLWGSNTKDAKHAQSSLLNS